MKIPESSWINYITKLTKVNSVSAEKMREFLKSYDLESDKGREQLINMAYALASRYGEAAAEIACEMYDAMVEASGLILPPAEPAATATISETAKAINGTIKRYMDIDQTASTVGRLVKTAGQDTTLKNALRDGAEYAWIPHGDTCAFCQVLASRGWQVMSKNALKGDHAEHIHPNCDCAYAIRFDDSTTYAGYDPDMYLEAYENAEGTTSKEKLNSMRRIHYEQNKELINAQKREAYREKELYESLQNVIENGNIIKGAASIPESTRVHYDAKAKYKVSVPEYSEELNNQISESARRVAEYGDRDSYEYAAIVDLNTAKEVDFGTSYDFSSVNSYYKFLQEHPSGRYAMVHNHNTASGLSLPDLQEMSMWENLESITAVQNDGPSYTIVSNGMKSKNYLPFEFENVGVEYSDAIEREKAQVRAAIEKYTTGEIRSDN